MKFRYWALISFILVLVLTAGCISVPTGKATLIVAVKDAPKMTSVGTVTHLILNISEVSVHRSATNQTIEETEREMTPSFSNDTDTAGWFVVVNETQTADLVQLQNVSQVLGQKILDAGNYTQIRLKIDSGTVTVDDVEYDLTVPSEVLKLNHGFVLRPGATLQLTLDFDVERSLSQSGSGQYKLEPVIAVLSA